MEVVGPVDPSQAHVPDTIYPSINPVRRGHHLAFNVRDLAAVKAELDKRGIPYGTSQVPGSPVQQAFFHDVEGNGIEAVYRPPVSEEL